VIEIADLIDDDATDRLFSGVAEGVRG